MGAFFVRSALPLTHYLPLMSGACAELLSRGSPPVKTMRHPPPSELGLWTDRTRLCALCSIPNCVLGGVTAFLFASIVVSGIQIVTLDGLSRRTRFILSLSLALGLGKALSLRVCRVHLLKLLTGAPLLVLLGSGCQALSVNLALSAGVTLVPSWASNHIWPIVPSMSTGLQSFRSVDFLA